MGFISDVITLTRLANKIKKDAGLDSERGDENRVEIMEESEIDIYEEDTEEVEKENNENNNGEKTI